jgi:hypothetical protein
MLSQHNINRIVAITAYPNRPQRPPRLRINNINNLAPGAENQPTGTRPDTIVKVLQRTTDQTAVGENRQFLPSGGESEIPSPQIARSAEVPARGFDGAVRGACIGKIDGFPIGTEGYAVGVPFERYKFFGAESRAVYDVEGGLRRGAVGVEVAALYY